MSHTPADPAPTHWAILIGVGMSIDSRAELGDEKQAWRRDQSLEGAVADIHMMERYLKDDPRVKISKLTATKPTHGAEKNTPLEPPEDQPTRKNVESLLKTIIKEGLSRNIHHVYIHFSGHGTDSSDGTFALSLFDPGPLGRVRFLTDHLATALQRITRQGIRVTVVLDCCFSGSMKRSSDVSASHVRFIEHDPSEDLMETENPFLEADTEGSRQAYLNLPHLLDPKGYVVITACGPRENAREVKLENGKRHGALSYFLHDSLMLLRRSEDQVSFETLYNRLQAKFHVNLPQQTPRHYGNMRESFFQNLSCESSRYLVTTVKVPDQEEFILKAGEAHGVHKGDQYEAYPYYASEVNSKALRKESVLLVVKEVENLQSKVMPVDHDQLERFKEVMTWKAQLITSKSDRKTLIYASKSLGVAEKDRLRKYLSNHPYVKLLEEDGDLGVSTFNISINNDESYEIREGDSRRAPNTPLFPRNEEDSLNLLSDALGHLATYKFFEGIENSHPDKCFGKSLDIETHSTPGPDQWFEVQDKAKFEFSIINKDKGTLFFAIFNLRSSWEVCNIMREAGEGSFFEIPIQDGGFRFPLPMKIPEAVRNKGGTQNEDIIKIFITNQVPYFPFSVLPKLGAGGDRQHVARNEMTKFLESLERGNGDTRQSTTGQWITRNFSIRTHV